MTLGVTCYAILLTKYIFQNGTIHGNILGIEKYLPKYKTGKEALIVNVSSTAGTQGYPPFPVYTATKHAVHGLVRSWGIPEYYEQTKVRVIGLCPGVTMTPLITEMDGKTIGSRCEAFLQNIKSSWPTQE